MTSVATTYFQTIEVSDRLAVANDNLASAEAILKGLQLQEDVGTVTALDVAQQETTVSTLNAAIPPLQEQLRQTEDALAILLGHAPQAGDGATGTLADLSLPIVSPGLPSELLTRRPDVAAAEAQLVSANANIAVARASVLSQHRPDGVGRFRQHRAQQLDQSGERGVFLHRRFDPADLRGAARSRDSSISRRRSMTSCWPITGNR